MKIKQFLAELDSLNINEKDQQLIKDWIEKKQSPKKFDFDTLDKKLQPFFKRDKFYYLSLEEYLKNSHNKFVMIKKFLNELSYRIRQYNFSDIQFLILYMAVKNKTLSIEKDFLCGDKYNEIIIENHIKSFDKINHCYPLKYNPWLFQNLFVYFLNLNKEFFNIIENKFNTNYFLINNDLENTINAEIFILKQIKEVLWSINKNYSLSKLIKFVKNNEFNFKIKQKISYIESYINNREKTFLKYYNFFDKLDDLNKLENKEKFIDFIVHQLNLIKNILDYNLEILLENLEKKELKIDDMIKEAFIKLLLNENSYIPIINFNSYPSSNKFYLELDFSLPENLLIEEIRSVYKEYKRGNIKTVEEYILNKQVKKYKILEKLSDNLIFKLKDEKKIPLYVKLTDLIYILDMWLIHMKNLIVIKEIENNRIRYYTENDKTRYFESTYKQYKKFIVDFYLNKEFENYL
jgi:hypothetical protein